MGLYICTLFPSPFSSIAVVWIQSAAFRLHSLIVLNKKHNGIPDFDRVCSISEAVYFTSYNWIDGLRLRGRGCEFRTLFKMPLLSFQVWGILNCRLVFQELSLRVCYHLCSQCQNSVLIDCSAFRFWNNIILPALYNF